MINHTIQLENVKRFVNLNHPDGVKECSLRDANIFLVQIRNGFLRCGLDISFYIPHLKHLRAYPHLPLLQK
jgi:hypothetical protein